MTSKRPQMPDPLAAVTDEVIMAQIAHGSRVIDLGCGNGRLLQRLQVEHDCRVQGVELDFHEFGAALGRGIPMIRADLTDGLKDIPSRTFDVAVLSQTLQQIRNPLFVLDEMLRVADRALVVVPNFGHWKVRLQVVLQGRAPVTDSLPYQWYESPNVHFLTMLDFRDLANSGNFKIAKELPIIGDRAVQRAWLANLRALCALYVLERFDA
jgi:methionine biosynthesis protein MetW